MPKGVDHLSNSPTERQPDAVQKSLMPKGVDHMDLRRSAPFLACVQKSLMPKGVDHFRRGRLEEETVIGAKIFDAERR